MYQIEHDLDVVGFYGILEGDDGLKVQNEDLYKRQGLLHQPSMPQCL